MKSINDIAFIVQSNLGNDRVPRKMVRPFAGTTLFDLVLDKLVECDSISNANLYASVHEEELRQIAQSKDVRIYHRSFESATNTSDVRTVYEWYKFLPHEYVVLISGDTPLLKIDTIDRFVKQFVFQKEESLFGVVKKHNFYWNMDGALVTPWPEGQTIMNIDAVEPTYEAAHCLYASRRDLIAEHMFMGVFEEPGGVMLFDLPELEAYNVHDPAQFKIAEKLYYEFSNEST